MSKASGAMQWVWFGLHGLVGSIDSEKCAGKERKKATMAEEATTQQQQQPKKTATATATETKVVGILTAGGLAPCLSSAVGGLIERYSEVSPATRILLYAHGYQGLLQGVRAEVTPAVRAQAALLHTLGGSVIGNSRVKLSNAADCAARGFVRAGQDPRSVAAEQLVRDGVDVLHTIGGDDTNTAAADLADYLQRTGHTLRVIGLPKVCLPLSFSLSHRCNPTQPNQSKTIDNDIVPVRQSLGALTAAEQAARFFANVVSEQTANPRVLLIHEVMGRACGYLTAQAARVYCASLEHRAWLPEIGHTRERYDVHAVYVPEMRVDLQAEAARLSGVMDRVGCVNIFLSEGAGIDAIVAEMEARGEAVPRDPFGHVKLDLINPGQWFGKQFGKMVGAEKVLVQKSGYFSRSAPPNAEDLRLIKGCVDLAVQCALDPALGSGLIGHDEERGGVLRPIEFARVKGGKPFDIDLPWFGALLSQIGQPKGEKLSSSSH